MLCSTSVGSVIMMFLADRWLIIYNNLLQCCVLHCTWLFVVCSGFDFFFPPVGRLCTFSCGVDADIYSFQNKVSRFWWSKNSISQLIGKLLQKPTGLKNSPVNIYFFINQQHLTDFFFFFCLQYS